MWNLSSIQVSHPIIVQVYFEGNISVQKVQYFAKRNEVTFLTEKYPNFISSKLKIFSCIFVEYVQIGLIPFLIRDYSKALVILLE